MTGGSFRASQPGTRGGAPKKSGNIFKVGPGMRPLTTLSYDLVSNSVRGEQ